MFDLSAPPSPPQSTQSFFEQLEVYYQEAISYHQQEIATAQNKLAAIEVLLDKNSEFQGLSHQERQESALVNNQTAGEINGQINEQESPNSSKEIVAKGNGNGVKVPNSKQLSLLENGSNQKEIAENRGNLDLAVSSQAQIKQADRGTEQGVSDVEISAGLKSERSGSATTASTEIKSQLLELSFEEIAPKITATFQENPGTILQIDYLLRKIFGVVAREQIEELKSKMRSLLVLGESQQLWHKVPDSPNCWTMDATLLTQLISPSSVKLERINANSDRETLLAAIAAVLKNAAPKQLSSQEISEAITPAKMKRKQKQRLYKRVQSLLPRWAERSGWKKIAAGVYVWDENQATGSHAGERSNLKNQQQKIAPQQEELIKQPVASVTVSSENSTTTQIESQKIDSSDSLVEELSIHAKGEVLLAAIDRTLKKAAPESLNSKQIAEALTPADVTRKQKTYFFKRIQSLLPNWAEQFGWKKLAPGVYLWEDNSATTSPEKEPTHQAATLESVETNLDEKDSERGMVESAQTSGKESAKNEAAQSSLTRSKNLKNLPAAPQLERYGTVSETIRVFIQEKAPVPVTASDILNWLYPEGLDKAARKKAYTCVSNCLSNYVNYKWVRVKQGFYTWDQKLAA